ncbi:MAG: four helix bundle protein [Candidatus Levybacteria bacterium]|nr:four helix bundle protein [Candidatus Levybacteria bacterium]
MIKSYKDLIFWQRALEVTKLVIKLCRELPKDRVSVILISQIIRSSASVGANIAEGYGRYKTKEYPRFLQIALGSANETEYWLILIKDTYPIFEKEIDIIIEKNLETIKMLSASLKTFKNS